MRRTKEKRNTSKLFCNSIDGFECEIEGEKEGEEMEEREDEGRKKATTTATATTTPINIPEKNINLGEDEIERGGEGEGTEGEEIEELFWRLIFFPIIIIYCLKFNVIETIYNILLALF